MLPDLIISCCFDWKYIPSSLLASAPYGHDQGETLYSTLLERTITKAGQGSLLVHYDKTVTLSGEIDSSRENPQFLELNKLVPRISVTV